MGRNGNELLAVFELPVAEPVILRAKDTRGLCSTRRSDDPLRYFSGRAAVASVEPAAAGGSHYQTAVGHRLTQRAEAAGVFEYFLGVDRHRPGPKALGPAAADNRQIPESHVFHRPGNRADVAGAFRLDQHDADVF